MPSNYERGRQNEYMCMRDMERRGYTCIRSPQSGGGWDVMAWNEVEVHFIQVKGYLKVRGSYAKDFAKLMAVPPTPNCIKSFWVRKTGQRGWESITTLWTNCQTQPEWLLKMPAGNIRSMFATSVEK